MAFVYIIQAHQLFKIGLTKKTVKSRIKQLQTGSSVDLKIRVILSTNRPDVLEKKLHGLFASKRRIGEWFELSTDEQQLLIPPYGTNGFCDFNQDKMVSRCSQWLKPLVYQLINF